MRRAAQKVVVVTGAIIGTSVVTLACVGGFSDDFGVIPTTGVDASFDTGRDSNIINPPFDANVPKIAASPTFNPPGSIYTSSRSVTISTTTPGATIYYTVDGSTPTVSSTMYSTPITVGNTCTGGLLTTNIRAIATAPGYTQSSVSSASYTIDAVVSVTAPPTISPAGGTYAANTTASITTTLSTPTICYTEDGTTPLCSPTCLNEGTGCSHGFSYVGTPVAVTKPVGGGIVTFKAAACNDTQGPLQNTATFTFTP
jgi:hypothetical protein